MEGDDLTTLAARKGSVLASELFKPALSRGRKPSAHLIFLDSALHGNEQSSVKQHWSGKFDN